MKEVDDEETFWIHRLNIDSLDQINQKKILAAKKVLPRKLDKNARIILLTNFENNLQFFAYTQVENIFVDDEVTLKGYGSKRKAKLKGIKYFNKPIKATELGKNLSFVKDKKNTASSLRSEYKQISKEDFKFIYKQPSSFISSPTYFEEFKSSVTDFIFKTVQMLHYVLKSKGDRKQIEIKEFIVLLKKVLDYYEVNKTFVEVQEYYVKNAWKFGFKHNPSRDHEKSIALYTSTGSSKNFSYISLE